MEKLDKREKTQDRRYVKTENAIQNAFLSLIVEKEYSQIRVTDIVNRANIGRKTFYLHYESKEDVLSGIRNNLFQTTNAKITKYVLQGQSYDIHNIFTDLNSVLLQYQSFLKATAKRDSYHLLDDIIKGALDQAITKVLTYRYHISTTNAPYYVMFYSSGISSLYISWLKGESTLSLDELTIVAKEVCFEGADALIERIPDTLKKPKQS
jgi:AcrR family transcriptional regulator